MGTRAQREKSQMYTRRAHHAGSWYSDQERVLTGELEGNLQKVPTASGSGALRAVICPHAGYSYSGPTAAHSYGPVRDAVASGGIQRIIVLHPSHHVYLEGCAVSNATALETPLGPLRVDDALRQEILQLEGFSTMSQLTDEEEHSSEMQYPYLKLCMGSKNIPVLPIMVGSISTRLEAEFGKRLASILSRPEILCVISSDFCHWGSRFRYQPTGAAEIYKYIQEIDNRGMDAISMQDPGAFATYLKETRNTICGRHPIGVWLQALQENGEEMEVSFVHYEQSSQVTSMRDSSVSYASAVARKKG